MPCQAMSKQGRDARTLQNALQSVHALQYAFA